MNGLLALARRQATAHRSVPVALVLLVLLVAGVVTAWPRLLADVDDRQTTHEIDGASPLTRDVIGVLPMMWPFLGAPEPGSTPFAPDVEANVGGILLALEELRAEQPEPLRSLLGDPRFWVTSTRLQLVSPPDAAIGRQDVSLKVEPQVSGEVEIIEGRWPDAPDVVDPFADLTEADWIDLTQEEYEELLVAAEAPAEAFEVALSVAAAEAFEWEVGTQRRVAGEPMPLLLTGVFEADDAESDYWVHNPYSAEPELIDDLNLGTSGHAAAYLNPAWDGSIPIEPHSMSSSTISFSTQVWYPLDVDALSATEVRDAAAQVVRFTAPQPLGPEGTGIEVRFATGLGEVLDRITQQQAVTSTVLAVVSAGPLGVTLAVFLLGAQLLVSRRRSALALLSARGGSGLQLRGMLALEGLVIGLPAAVVGAAVAIALVPGRTAPADLVLTGVVALAPAALLAATSSPRGLREGRADLGARRSRWRWIAEVVVLGATAAALVLLRQRGVDPGAGDTDVLLTTVPLLLAVSTCVLVLRLYPLPVRALAGVLRRRRGLTAFLGSARAVRDPAGGLVPAVALVIGVSVAVFSAVLSVTVSTGVRTTAWQGVGADLRLTGPVIDAETVADVEALPGVARATAIASGGTVTLSGERVDLVLVDPDAVRDVQADGVGIETLPEALTTGTVDGRVPAVLATGVAAAVGAEPGTDAQISVRAPVELTVVGTMDTLAGSGARNGVLAVDRAAFAEATGRDPIARTMLIAVDDGADPTEVLERVREVVPVARAQNPAGDASNFLASPMAGGMNAAITVAVLLSVVLVVVAVVMTQLLGAPARTRLVAVLRTLGIDRRQIRGTVAWELAPLAVVAILAGGLLGVLVPWVVLGAMDLRALTGGADQPALVLDPLIIGGVLGGVGLVAAMAIGVSAMMSSRADTATELRMGEET